MAQFSTNNHLIYVMDDDTPMARLISVNLAARGYRVKGFDSGSQAIADLKITPADLVILEMMMPEPDGLEVTRQIGQISQVPIMNLSVRGQILDKLTALDMGANDYVTKLFGIEELLARTRAILRLTAPATKEEIIPSNWNYRFGGVFVDLDGLRVISHDCGKQLTPQEWAILRVFIKYAERVVAPRILLQEAWGSDYAE